MRASNILMHKTRFAETVAAVIKKHLSSKSVFSLSVIAYYLHTWWCNDTIWMVFYNITCDSWSNAASCSIKNNIAGGMSITKLEQGYYGIHMI